MSLVLPSTVEELNYMQNTVEFRSFHPVYTKGSDKGFENIDAGRYKREISLPTGTDWEVDDFEPYLNFEETPFNNFEVIKSEGDRLVPGDEQRQRSESFSSVSSSMDDKSLVYHNMGIKTFNTVCIDSGSTCISSDHAYVTPVFKGLESEETFQNLNPYINQGPEIHTTDTTSSISSVNSPLNESLEYSVLSNFSVLSNNSEDSFSERSLSLKRSTVSSDDIFMMDPSKRVCKSPDVNRYLEVRKRNNIASKNCRKTRKEKQKEMDMKVVDLLREKEELNNQIIELERMTTLYKMKIESILKPRPHHLV